jgi:hypothetical protein
MVTFLIFWEYKDLVTQMQIAQEDALSKASLSGDDGRRREME